MSTQLKNYLFAEVLKSAASRDFHTLSASEHLSLFSHHLSSDPNTIKASGKHSSSSSSSISPGCSTSERGNQRDRDRERAQARSSGNKSKPKNDGLTPEQCRERDAKALQEKAKKKAAAQQAGGINAGGKK
ncbi:hypothetical protein C1H46_002097 [Malus baccata]|uniref:Small EDRK-rich factor-like N-terminal domain-containing protein n=1 Tax=Malus baccata TaxID=106549 RepID=A0A540NN37_MALBA|nr:hypothetical protein C1H46_002097 [Malus baccata]